MRFLAGLGIVVVWAALCAGGWALAKDRPLLPSHDPAPRLGPDTRIYLDRDYRLETVPDFLESAVVVRTFRHGADPVHLRLEGPAVLWRLATEGEIPDSWGEAVPAGKPVLCRGARGDLTHAYRTILPAGDHEIHPIGPHRIASPLLVVGSSEVREIETPAGLLRRADLATRGFPRRALATLLAALVLLGSGLGIAVAARRAHPTSPGNDLAGPPA